MQRVLQVRTVLDEYADYLPMTLRQIFYRLVGRFDYVKTENAYEQLSETLNRARRSGLIPFEAIRDDGAVQHTDTGFHDRAHFWRSVQLAAKEYRRDRLVDQPCQIEVWCEAAGMAPQLVRVAERYGVPVYSSGGFDSVTVKYEAAQRLLGRDVPTVVLHVGDLDPSGHAIYDVLREDVPQLAADLGYQEAEADGDPEEFDYEEALASVRFARVVAVTSEQVAQYGLPTRPPKPSDRRGGFKGGTVQAEALDPAALAAAVDAGIRDRLDLDVYERTVATEAEERQEILDALDEVEQ